MNIDELEAYYKRMVQACGLGHTADAMVRTLCRKYGLDRETVLRCSPLELIGMAQEMRKFQKQGGGPH